MAGWSFSKDKSELNCTENPKSNEFNDNDCSSDGSDSGVKWDECDNKLRDIFDQVLMALLRGVHAKNMVRPIPPLLGDGKSVDLFKLYFTVRDRGGYCLVSNEKLWGLVAEKVGFEYRVGPALKLIYFKYLYELDRWLNRIAQGSISSNGSYECGGSLGMLSMELEKRYMNVLTHGKELVLMDEEIKNEKDCKNVDMGFNEILHSTSIKVQNDVVITANNDNHLYERKEFLAKYNHGDIDEESSSRKRKRDNFVGLLSWMKNVAKNHCHPSFGAPPACSRWKEIGDNDFWSIALSLRNARLCKRYADLNEEFPSSSQKKPKMHPSMYEDDMQNHHNSEALRSSKRLLPLTKMPLDSCRCQSNPLDHCHLGCFCKGSSKDGCKEKETLIALQTPTTVGRFDDDDLPIEKYVSVGPHYQADVPVWVNASESDSKWLGTQVWTPDFSRDNFEFELPGKGRARSCHCMFPGSVECYRFHIAEKRMKLRRELGLVFFHWKFDRMGEEVSLSWSVEEEDRFKHIVKFNEPSLGMSFFPRKTRPDLVSYYYNVFLIKRRSYQNRVTPKDIDSDDDEAEFGSVGEPFGFKALKIPGLEPLKCQLNMQVVDMDL